VAKDDLPNESMKKDKAMEFNSNKEISDNVGIDSEVQKSSRQKRKPALHLPTPPKKKRPRFPHVRALFS
jgi:hypothetical protein